ncbi:hypothetical protein EG329_000130 [Mollisiaceae sp. DMI_Dod_QoI]|nr:hypothetical protein EG329_000130 [Helotiales sp. DMI_Dod_QoI]
MSYRVEMSISNRAICQATECKKAKVKIAKDELRLGTWVEIEERGSWRWRHWGCVTGKMLQNIRAKLEDPSAPGTYKWDYLDGYEGDEKGSLERYPDMQEKVRRCINQGFIDPEDFNGDPEMNKLGENGLYTKESKKKIREDQLALARTQEIEELEAQIASLEDELAALKAKGGPTSKIDNQLGAIKEQLEEKSSRLATPTKKKAAPKKRGRANDDDGEETEAATPVKKKRATKAKKEVDSDGEEVKPAPAKKSRAKKAVKKEEDEEMEDGEEVKPAPKKSRAKKAKAEADEHLGDEEEAKPAPAKKSRAKKAVKQESDAEMTDEEEAKPTPAKKSREKKAIKEEHEDAPATTVPKKRAARAKKVVKEEPVEDETMTGVEASIGGLAADSKGNTALLKEVKADVKGEPSDAVNLPSDIAEPAVEPVGVKAEEPAEKEPVEEEPVELKKGTKGKKAAATKGTRTSRSRTASKA